MARPDLIALLAHLDFLVEGPKESSREDVETEGYIHKVLAELAKRFDNRYTVKQIRERLWQEFQRGYRYPEDNFGQLFRHGSSEIRSLDSKTEKLVKQQRDAILVFEAQKPERNLRSGPIHLGSELLPRRRHGTTSTLVHVRSSTNKTRTKIMQMDKSHKNKKARSRGVLVSQGRMKQSTAIIPSIEIDETPLHSPISSPATRDTTTLSPSSVEVPNGRLTPPTQSMMLPGIRKSCEVTKGPFPASVSTEIDLNVLSELSYYKDRCDVAEQECVDLKRERRQLESLYEETEGVPAELIKALNRNIRHVSTLKKKLDNLRDLEPYLSIGTPGINISTAPRVFSFFRDMKAQLSAILVSTGTDEPSPGWLDGASDDLNDLLSTVLNDRSQDGTEPMLDVYPALALHELIQTLTGAAIHLWVFASHYRPHALTTTPLLQKYRDHIATLHDNDSLHNLDTAVHQSIVREKSFVDVSIPGMSSTLTTRLLDALRPLLDQKPKLKMAKNLKPLLHRVFCLAFQIRSATLVGTEEYESIWPMFGITLNESEMEIKSVEPATVGQVVRLPLCPGLRIYSKKSSMVEYHGFRTSEGSEQISKLVIKALVLV
ncbi:Nn.00g061870.m01.CDS01 [Neocucurbitaria sp. VM-36]